MQSLRDIANQQRTPRSSAFVAGCAVQQIGAEHQNVAGISRHWRSARMVLPRRLFDPLASMRARHHLGGAVFRSEWIEEGQRGNRLGLARIRRIAVEEL